MLVEQNPYIITISSNSIETEISWIYQMISTNEIYLDPQNTHTSGLLIYDETGTISEDQWSSIKRTIAMKALHDPRVDLYTPGEQMEFEFVRQTEI